MSGPGAAVCGGWIKMFGIRTLKLRSPASLESFEGINSVMMRSDRYMVARRQNGTVTERERTPPISGPPGPFRPISVRVVMWVCAEFRSVCCSVPGGTHMEHTPQHTVLWPSYCQRQSFACEAVRQAANSKPAEQEVRLKGKKLVQAQTSGRSAFSSVQQQRFSNVTLLNQKGAWLTAHRCLSRAHKRIRHSRCSAMAFAILFIPEFAAQQVTRAACSREESPALLAVLVVQ